MLLYTENHSIKANIKRIWNARHPILFPVCASEKPSWIALSSIEEIQSRSTGFLQPH